MMDKLFIPTDRIGLESCQKSIGDTFCAVNALLRAGAVPEIHTCGVYFDNTQTWPEGHYYQSGFSIDNTPRFVDIADSFGLIYEKVTTVPTDGRKLHRKSIALYNGRGAGEDFSAPLIEVLKWGGFDFDFVDDADIRCGRLKDFGIMLVPGSPDAGECYYAGLGDKGYCEIRSFLAEGGEYLGICGGAYLPLTSYNTKNRYWLNIVEATDTEDLDYWRTGSGFVRCRIEDDSHPIFTSIALGASSTMNLVYWEGPAITIKGGNVRTLAHFETLLACGREPMRPYWDMHDNTMAHDATCKWYNPLTPEIFNKLLCKKTAFAEAIYRGQRILLFSPHPEMGNIGYGKRKDSLNFLLIYNGLAHLFTEK